MVLTYADASTGPGKTTADADVVEARYVDIVPGVRVVQEVTFVADDPDLAGTMTMTWEVTATDEGRAWTSAPTRSPTASPRRTMRPGSRHRWPTSQATSSRTAVPGWSDRGVRASKWTPRESIEQECARRGKRAVVDGCVDLLPAAEQTLI